MMWLLFVANLTTGELRHYELRTAETCSRAVAMIERGGMARAWCVPGHKLISVSERGA